MERRTALEMTIAGGLTAIGIFTGNPAVLTGLVSVAGSMGANWAADLVQDGYRHWCEHWFTPAGALNEDVQRALAAAFGGAVTELERTWPQSPAYKRLKRDEQALTRDGLKLLARDGQALCEQAASLSAAQAEEMLPFLQQQDAAGLRRRLRAALAGYFYGYPEAFLDFISRRLLDLWIARFEHIIKGADDTGTRAWRALQLAWQASLQAALAQMQADATETRRMVQWLQDWAQRLQTLPPGQRDDTGLAALEKALAPVHERLDAIHADTQAIRKGVDELLDRVRPTPSRPRTLPGAASIFLGREKELDQVTAALRPDAAQAHTVLIHGIRGMGGVGKTELALQAAWRLLDAYPDGQIFLDCQLSGAARPPDALLEALFRAFAPEEKPANSLADRQAQVRALLGGKQGLLVLDNAADGQQLRPVLAAIPGGWAVLITSRRRFGLQGGRTVDLNVLQPEAAVNLLAELLPGRDDAPALARLAKLCGYLPLALRIAAAFLVNHPDWSLDEYLAALAQARLAHLREEGEGDVAAVLGLSLRQLEAQDGELAARWRRLAVMAAPFGRAMAAAVWDVDEAAARDALSELVRWSLVEFDRESGRYSLHDLLRELAGPPEEAAVRRHATYALQEARAADDRFKEGAAVVEALARFDNLWPHLQAAWQRLHARDDEAAHRWLRDFGYAFIHLFDLRTTPAERIPYLKAAVQAARATGDRRGEGIHLGNLGNAYADLGRVEEAIDFYRQALAISRETGDRRGEGNHLGNLGSAYYRLGRLEEAIDFYRQALAIHREIGDRRGEGAHLGNLGLAYADLGRLEEAIDFYRQALAISREIGDRRGEGSILGNLGLAYAALGRLEEAIAYHEQALAISREIGDRRGEGNHLGNLGRLYAEIGQPEEGLPLLLTSLDIKREIGERTGEGEVLNYLGFAHYLLGDLDKALDLHRQGIALLRDTQYRRPLGLALSDFAAALLDVGALENAWQAAAEALTIAEEIGDRFGEAQALRWLGRVALASGDVAKACQHWRQALAIFEAIRSPHAETVRRWLAQQCGQR